MDKIGVIVPVYNVEQYLHRCVESILNQTYPDFELVLLDDGSPDSSGKICDEYASKDSRIHAFHLEHVGVSAIRNEGIRWVLEDTDCQWVLFIDSDDWVHPEMLERLMRGIKTFDVSVCVSGYGETMDDTPPWGPEIEEAELWTPEDLYRKRFINATIPVAKLCHRSCFVGKKYPEGKIHEDEYVTFHILFEQKVLAAIGSPMYAYYYNPQSITKKPWTPDRLDSWGAYEQQIKFFEARGNPELVKFRYRGYLENAMVNLAEAENYHDQEAIRPLIRKMKRRIRSVIRRAWKLGIIDFRLEYDMLERFYPLPSKIYRFIREHKEK